MVHVGGHLVQLRERFEQVRHALREVIVGKPSELDQCLIGLLSGGHILLEDLPGVGKTTLAKALAKCMGGVLSRVQFTPDLLPTDIIGVSVFNPKDGGFHFQKGPIFCDFLLADEINRASPRTQSALLEAMGERQVTVEGSPRPLEAPFFVIATQNPIESHGTYPLPEAQLDRFTMRLTLGYPPYEQELRVLKGEGGNQQLASLTTQLSPTDLIALQERVGAIEVEDSVMAYLLNIVVESRRHHAVKVGISPRGALSYLACVRGRAFLENRDFVVPEDVQTMAKPVMAHRLLLQPEARYAGTQAAHVVEELLTQVEVPR